MNNGYYHPYYAAYPYAAPDTPLGGNAVSPYAPPMPPGYAPSYAMPGAYPAAAAIPTVRNTNLLTNPRFIKGALIGAAVAYLLTNEKVQHATIKTAVKAWSLVQGGVEEMKERFRDAEAELHAADQQE